MGVFGITEHRWRGVSMVEPLGPADKQQLLQLAHDLNAGSLGRRPEPPACGPVAPSQQVLLDVHSILAAAAATASAFGLLYEGFPEAALHAKLASYIRGAASSDNICTQDCFKAMRKNARRVLQGLCKSAPRRPHVFPSASSSGGLFAPSTPGADASTASLSKLSSSSGLLKRPGPKKVAKAFMYACLMQQSRSQPERLVQAIARFPLDGAGGSGIEGALGQEACVLAEAMTLVPLAPGTEYLRLLGDKYLEQVEYMEEFGRMRPSDAKKETEVQGMTINARVHEVGLLRPQPHASAGAKAEAGSVEAGPDSWQRLYACPRSGAFAVHGRGPRGAGLSSLTLAYASCHALPLAQQRAVLARLGFSDLSQLQEEVELRKAMCVAQALPVIVASLRLMCSSGACVAAAYRTGTFLHVQHSLLSDTHRHERAYLEDTRGALDVLAEKLTIRFVAGSAKVLPLHLSGSSGIVVSLSADTVSDEALAAAGCDRDSFCGQSYGLTTALFNQGINSLQSLGLLLWRGGELLQDILNRQSLEKLNDYALRAGHNGGPALAALNRHYSPAGWRGHKDMAMFALVRHACHEVGAGRAVNCKSGKDRTALELAKAAADEVVMAGVLASGKQSWLEAQLLRGLCYLTTSQNHGQPPAYAFNEMEILSLPPGWRPDWRLCGKVAS